MRLDGGVVVFVLSALNHRSFLVEAWLTCIHNANRYVMDIAPYFKEASSLTDLSSLIVGWEDAIHGGFHL